MQPNVSGAKFLPDSVDVQSICATLAKSLLHGSLQRGPIVHLVKPVGVGSAVSGNELEAQTGGRVVLVQDCDLVCDLGVTEQCTSAIEDTEDQGRDLRDIATCKGFVL